MQLLRLLKAKTGLTSADNKGKISVNGNDIVISTAAVGGKSY